MNSDDDALPWHDAVWNRVAVAVREQTLAQALLLCGPAGVGKRRFARRLAAALLCETPTVDGEACGVCRGCAQFAAGSHPNLVWLQRAINPKTDKEKRDISMEQLRAMMDTLSLASHYGLARVVLIDPADALNTAGVNALLKTVEEPRPGNYVLLLSERPMDLAATLRSRCQRLNFAPPPPAQALAWLTAQQPGIDAVAALADAGGAPLAALDLHRNGQSARRRNWQEVLLSLAEGRGDPLAAALQVDKNATADWLPAYQTLLHRLQRAAVGLDADAQLIRIARRVSPEIIAALFAEATEGRRRLAGNASPQLLIESLMISWWRRTAAAPGNRDFPTSQRA